MLSLLPLHFVSQADMDTQLKRNHEYDENLTSSCICCSSPTPSDISTGSVTSAVGLVFTSRPSFKETHEKKRVDSLKRVTSSRTTTRHFNKALKSPLPSTLRSSKLILMSGVVILSSNHLYDNQFGYFGMRKRFSYRFSSSVSNVILFARPSTLMGSGLWTNSLAEVLVKSV